MAAYSALESAFSSVASCLMLGSESFGLQYAMTSLCYTSSSSSRGGMLTISSCSAVLEYGMLWVYNGSTCTDGLS